MKFLNLQMKMWKYTLYLSLTRLASVKHKKAVQNTFHFEATSKSIDQVILAGFSNNVGVLIDFLTHPINCLLEKQMRCDSKYTASSEHNSQTYLLNMMHLLILPNKGNLIV